MDINLDDYEFAARAVRQLVVRALLSIASEFAALAACEAKR